MIPADYYAYTLQLIGTSGGLKQAEKWLKTHSIAGDEEPIVPGFLNEAEDIEKNGSVIGRAFTLQWGSISEEPGLKPISSRISGIANRPCRRKCGTCGKKCASSLDGRTM